MKKLAVFAASVVTLGSLGLSVIAADAVKDVETKPVQVEASPEVVARIENALKQVSTQVPIVKVSASSMPGLYEVILANEQLIYVNEQGSHFVVGDLYSVSPEGDLANLSEESRQFAQNMFAERRKTQMEVLKKEDLIIFPAEGDTKAVITVFTDIDCGYCRKLHSEMDGYNKAGIEVRYAAFPRAGANSNSAQKYVNAWCAKDKLTAITDAKKLKTLPEQNCANPISAQYNLGKEIGVKGTPAIVTADGHLIPGYMPPSELANRLGL